MENKTVASKFSELEAQKLGLIADYFAEYEPGDFISSEEFQQTFGREFIDYRALQTLLTELYDLSLWVVRPANALGFILITAEAQEKINSLNQIKSSINR